MKKSDFKKGQTVYLLIVENGNKYHVGGYAKRPFEERIKEATVISVGRQYITVELEGTRFSSEERFDTNYFNHCVDYGGSNYKLFLTKQDIYDCQEKRGLVKEIRDAINTILWNECHGCTLDQMRRIRSILDENK